MILHQTKANLYSNIFFLAHHHQTPTILSHEKRITMTSVGQNLCHTQRQFIAVLACGVKHQVRVIFHIII